jgi:hypothetical protein
MNSKILKHEFIKKKFCFQITLFVIIFFIACSQNNSKSITLNTNEEQLSESLSKNYEFRKLTSNNKIISEEIRNKISKNTKTLLNKYTTEDFKKVLTDNSLTKNEQRDSLMRMGYITNELIDNIQTENINLLNMVYEKFPELKKLDSNSRKRVFNKAIKLVNKP